MGNKIILKIGEFSKLCQVSVKTIRFYEECRLLLPVEVDEWTNYRYYEASQIAAINQIKYYRRLGFSIEQIKEIMWDGLSPSVEMIDTKLSANREAKELIEWRESELLRLKSEGIASSRIEFVTIKTLPEIVVAAHRQTIGSYNRLAAVVENVVLPAIEHSGARLLSPRYCYSFCHNSEYSDCNIDIEYCEAVDESGGVACCELEFKRVECVEQALCFLHQGRYEDLPESWAKLYDYIERNGFSVVGNPRFSYLNWVGGKSVEVNRNDYRNLSIEIQVPVGQPPCNRVKLADE